MFCSGSGSEAAVQPRGTHGHRQGEVQKLCRSCTSRMLKEVSLAQWLLMCSQGELKESHHTPDPGPEKKSRVMDQPQELALLQSMSYCCEAYSESSQVTSISGNSTMERLECLHTTSHTKTISLSLLPSSAIPGFSDIRREFCQPEEQVGVCPIPQNVPKYVSSIILWLPPKW